MQKSKETMTGLMLGDTPLYFDLNMPRSRGVLVNPNRVGEAVDFLLKATGREPMIKVIITGPPKNGYFPYRVDWWFQGRPQLVGLSPAPLMDACRQLQQMGLMDSTVVGLFDEEDNGWSFRTTVGYGATHLEDVMGKYREFPGGPIKDAPPITGGIPTGTATVEPQAIPEEEPPSPRTPPEPPADTGRAHREPDRPDPPHHKRKRAGSGARRGSR